VDLFMHGFRNKVRVPIDAHKSLLLLGFRTMPIQKISPMSIREPEGVKDNEKEKNNS